jgi:hypothetical protein
MGWALLSKPLFEHRGEILRAIGGAANAYADSNSECDGYSNAKAYTDSKTYSGTKSSPNTSAAPVGISRGAGETRFVSNAITPQGGASHPPSRGLRREAATVPVEYSARNALEHFSVRREFFHKHQQTLNGFLRFVTGKPAPDEINLLQFPRLQ